MVRCYSRHWLALALLAVAPLSHADPFTASAGDEPLFESTFKGYVPDEDLEPGGWLEANDRVGQIGGWRTYLKEAQERPEPMEQARPAMAGERVPPAKEATQ